MTDGFITEFADDDFDPGFYGKVVFGAGPKVASFTRSLVCIGAINSSADMAVNTIQRAFSKADVRRLAGTRSELSRMGLRVLDAYPNIELYLAALAPADGAVAATCTLTVAGSWTTSGELTLWVAGDRFKVVIDAGATLAATATKIAAAFSTRPDLAASAAASVANVVLTWGSAGTRGNGGIVYLETGELPAGCTVTLSAGGATISGDLKTGNGRKFSGGVGTEDVTTLLPALATRRFGQYAVAVRDDANLALLETHLQAKAAYDVLYLEHLTACVAGDLSAAQATQLGMNHPRLALLWYWDGETPAPEVAAAAAAQRTVLGASMVNRSYSSNTLFGIRPQRDPAKWLLRTHRIAALKGGITPVQSTADRAFIVRGITTRCLDDDGAPDYRTLDWATAEVPDYVMDRLKIRWFNYRTRNPHVEPDPPQNAERARVGVATPKLWLAEINTELGLIQAAKIITGVGTTGLIAETSYNAFANRILAKVPVKPLPLHEQTELVVEQN